MGLRDFRVSRHTSPPRPTYLAVDPISLAAIEILQGRNYFVVTSTKLVFVDAIMKQSKSSSTTLGDIEPSQGRPHMFHVNSTDRGVAGGLTNSVAVALPVCIVRCSCAYGSTPAHS